MVIVNSLEKARAVLAAGGAKVESGDTNAVVALGNGGVPSSCSPPAGEPKRSFSVSVGGMITQYLPAAQDGKSNLPPTKSEDGFGFPAGGEQELGAVLQYPSKPPVLQYPAKQPAPLNEFARRMRKAPTPWEKKLWRLLKSEQLAGYKFRRQVPIDHYIADFVNYEKRVIIELDGSHHLDSAYDGARDAYLKTQGFRILRFWNNELDTNIEGVRERIAEALNMTPHRNALRSVSTPPQGGSREFGVPIALCSPPFAACHAGVHYHLAMVAQLRSEFPGTDFTYTLCCGDDAAIAHDALRLGFRHILCDCREAQFAELQTVAERLHATLARGEAW